MVDTNVDFNLIQPGSIIGCLPPNQSLTIGERESFFLETHLLRRPNQPTNVKKGKGGLWTRENLTVGHKNDDGVFGNRN